MIRDFQSSPQNYFLWKNSSLPSVQATVVLVVTLSTIGSH
jgi:hypothetical protein